MKLITVIKTFFLLNKKHQLKFNLKLIKENNYK